jgi:hypothetical protein
MGGIVRYPMKLVWSFSLVAAAACSSDVTSNNAGTSNEARSGSNATATDRLLQRIGKGLAIALKDQSLRSWVQHEIATSPYVESRIPLRDVLLNRTSEPAVRSVQQRAALTSGDLNSLRRFPHLELYMPIESQRQSWRGTDDIEVAVRRPSEDYVLFRIDGSARVVPENYQQQTPTLVLAVSEIDYADVDLAVRGGSRSGTGMGAPVRANEAFSTLPSSSFSEVSTAFGTDPSQWSHLTQFKTNFDHDGGLSGSDEVEVFGSIDGGTQFCVRKANVSKGIDYFLDPNAIGTTLAKAVPTSPSTLFVNAWEDDSGYCVHTGSDDHYGEINLTVSQYGQMFGTSNPGHIAVRVNASPAP